MDRVRAVLEAFLTRRPPPDQLVNAGILTESPANTGPAKFFGQPISSVPLIDNVPGIVVETCSWMRENNGTISLRLFNSIID